MSLASSLRTFAAVVGGGLLAASCSTSGTGPPAAARAVQAATADVGATTSAAGPSASCAERGRDLLARATATPPPVPVTLPTDNTPSEVPAAAVADLVASIGVNIHATYNDTPYGDHDRLVAALRHLGVRHVRDGLVPERPDQYQVLRRLAGHGVCSTLIIGEVVADPTEIDLALGWLAEVAPAVELIESPNEVDLAIGDGWQAALSTYEPLLAERIDEVPGVPDVPLIGPSYGRLESVREGAALRLPFDLVALHPYPGGEPPSSTLEANLWAAGATDGDAIVATEHGYHTAVNATGGQPGVPEDVAAAYVPRLFLESFAAGVDRTYLYELLDEFPDPEADDAESHFGLLRNDYSEKPAATALRTMLDLLETDDAGTGGPPPLGIRIETTATDVDALLLSAGRGAWWLAVWRRTSLYDTASRQQLDAPAVPATVVFDRRLRARVHRPVMGTDAEATQTARTSVALDVPPDPLLVRLEVAR